MSPAKLSAMAQETTAAALPDENIHGTAGTMMVIDVATPMIVACRRLRFGSERNWLAAIPSPSAMSTASGELN